METLLNRYRNITVLLLAIFAQLVLLGYQVKSNNDVRMIRVWAVGAVTPAARIIEGLRSTTVGIFENYFLLRDLREENIRIKTELGKLKVENQFLKSELGTAERAKALAAFQEKTPSRTIAARVFATGGGANARVLFVDRGSMQGVKKGMAVITPDGIVGKILAAYPLASQVMLATDPDFAAGVISQKTRARGTLKGQGHANCKVDYIPIEEKIAVGETFYTSGDDRIFPAGFPAGVVRVAKAGTPFQEIWVEPAALRHGLEEVLIVMEASHQPIPEGGEASPEMYMAPPPPAPTQEPVADPAAGAASSPVSAAPRPAGGGTEADKLRQKYEAIGAAQGHKFGEGLPGSKPPNFNLKLQTPAAGTESAPAAVPPAGGAAKPAAPKPEGEPLEGAPPRNP